MSYSFNNVFQAIEFNKKSIMKISVQTHALRSQDKGPPIAAARNHRRSNGNLFVFAKSYLVTIMAIYHSRSLLHLR